MTSTSTAGAKSMSSTLPSPSTKSSAAPQPPGPVGPSDIPGERIRGPRAWFVQPSSLGLRLVHVLPIGPADRPLGVVAVEYPLSPSPAGASIGRADYLLATRIGPASLRMQYRGGRRAGAPQHCRAARSWRRAADRSILCARTDRTRAFRLASAGRRRRTRHSGHHHPPADRSRAGSSCGRAVEPVVRRSHGGSRSPSL